MNMITRVSSNWNFRPNDQRFESLLALGASCKFRKDNSKATVVSSRQLLCEPVSGSADETNIHLLGPNGNPVRPTHWSFGQLAGLAGAPAGYLRKLHPALASDNLNYGFRVLRDIEDVGCLLTRTLDADGNFGPAELRAATGPDYGRIWDAEIVDGLIKEFGDGREGRFRVPGTFGGELTEATKANSTIFGSDRDIFVFLADQQNRVEVANRRNGQPGSLARGFMVWNSEVGSQTAGIACFLFDFMCSNRMIWGVDQFKEIKIRHTKSAPDRWLHEVLPIITEYANAPAGPIEETIRRAQQSKLRQDVDVFLKSRKFTSSQITSIKDAHEREEGRPIETLWDAATGITAAAKSVTHQDQRVTMERMAGKVLDLVPVVA